MITPTSDKALILTLVRRNLIYSRCTNSFCRGPPLTSNARCPHSRLVLAPCEERVVSFVQANCQSIRLPPPAPRPSRNQETMGSDTCPHLPPPTPLKSGRECRGRPVLASARSPRLGNCSACKKSIRPLPAAGRPRRSPKESPLAPAAPVLSSAPSDFASQSPPRSTRRPSRWTYAQVPSGSWHRDLVPFGVFLLVPTQRGNPRQEREVECSPVVAVVLFCAAVRLEDEVDPGVPELPSLDGDREGRIVDAKAEQTNGGRGGGGGPSALTPPPPPSRRGRSCRQIPDGTRKSPPTRCVVPPTPPNPFPSPPPARNPTTQSRDTA